MSELEPQLEPASIPTPPVPLALYRKLFFRLICVLILVTVGFSVYYLISLNQSITSDFSWIRAKHIINALRFGSVGSLFVVFAPGIYHLITGQQMTKKHMQRYSAVLLLLSISSPVMSFVTSLGNDDGINDTLYGMSQVAVICSILGFPLGIICLIGGYVAFRRNHLSIATFIMALPILNFVPIALIVFAPFPPF